MNPIEKNMHILSLKEGEFILTRMQSEELSSFIKIAKVQIPGFIPNKKTRKLNSTSEKRIRLHLKGDKYLIKYIQQYVTYLEKGNYLDKFKWVKNDIKEIIEFSEKNFKNDTHKIMQQNLILYKIIVEKDFELKKAYLEYLGFEQENLIQEEIQSRNIENELEKSQERIKKLQVYIEELEKKNNDKKNKLDDYNKELNGLNRENKELKNRVDTYKKKIDDSEEKIREKENVIKEKESIIREKDRKTELLKKFLKDETCTLFDITVYGSDVLVEYIKKSLNTEHIKINDLEDGELIFFYDVDHSNDEKNRILASLRERDKKFIILKNYEDTKKWIEQLGGLKWKINNQKTQILDILEK